LISLCTFSLISPISLCALSPISTPDTDRQTRTFPLPPARAISLEITVGNVTIEGSDRSDAVIEIVRHAPTSDALAKIPVQIDEEELEIRLRGAQPDSGTDPSLRTDITLRVPHQAVLRSVRIMEGRLSLSGLRGAVTADVRRGAIDAVDLQGVVRLEAGIGNVIVNRARLSADGLLRLRAFNGDVRLTLVEKPSDARILALALNGTISSQIPLRMKDTWGPRWGEATLGKGEPVISIDVITGKIDIRVD
jgi:hypothetical protein